MTNPSNKDAVKWAIAQGMVKPPIKGPSLRSIIKAKTAAKKRAQAKR